MVPARLIVLTLSVIIFLVSQQVLGAIVGPLVAAWRLGPVNQERVSSEVPEWGQLFDPSEDCSIRSAAKTLDIQVPGALHALNVETAEMTAPRVLRPVEGDFVAEVTVTGEVSPQGDRTSSHWLPYHGAGLLVWLDRNNYIRLERAAIKKGSGSYHYINFELRRNAMAEFSTGTSVPSGAITLRLERRGPRVVASYRREDQDWVKIRQEGGVRNWDNALKVGVVAINTSTDAFAARFENFQVGPAFH